jgi:glutamate 5-kinase
MDLVNTKVDHMKGSRVVIKIGTNSLVKGDRLAVGTMANLVEACVALQERGCEVVVVCSGAVGVGCQRMGLVKRPTSMAAKQALAAVGQIRLMSMFDDLFAAAKSRCAQVLLTFENLSLQGQHSNARNTFDALLTMGVVPIVNENDTVATHELKFGDNDRLSAMVCALVGAQWLFLLTDVDGVYTANPKTDPSARRLSFVQDVDELTSIVNVGDGAGSAFSTGGMATKLAAARLASAAGAITVIMCAKQPLDILTAMSYYHSNVIRNNESKEGITTSTSTSTDKDEEFPVGTLILPKGKLIRKDRKRWILGLRPEGIVIVNDGAANALKRKKSLFPAGVVGVQGNFKDMSCVSIWRGTSSTNIPVFSTGVGDVREIGIALVNFTSDDLNKILGSQSDACAAILGRDATESVVAHRNNIVLMENH